MHKQTLPGALLRLTTVSSLSLGIGTTQALAVDIPAIDDMDVGTNLSVSDQSVSGIAVTDVTPPPPIVTTTPSLRPRFSGQAVVKVEPKAALSVPEIGAGHRSAVKPPTAEDGDVAATTSSDSAIIEPFATDVSDASTPSLPTSTEILSIPDEPLARGVNSDTSALEERVVRFPSTIPPNQEPSQAEDASVALNSATNTAAAQPVELAPDGPLPHGRTTEPPAAITSYQVQSGDTLIKIARQHNIPVELLAQANEIQDVNMISSDTDLVIPSLTEMVAEPTEANAIDLGHEADSLQSIGQLNYLLSTVSHPVNSVTLLQQLQGATQTNQATSDSLVNSTSSPETHLPSETMADENGADAVEVDIFTANLLQDIDAIQHDQPRQLAIVPVLAPVSSSVDSAEPFIESSIDSSLVAAAPISTYLQPISVGETVEPQMPVLPSSQEYLPPSAVVNGYIWPSQGRLSSVYGWRWGRMHRGVDIAAPTGTPVMAAASGIVEHAGWNNGGYGNLVDIRHPDGSLTRYAHNHRVVVRAGQQVVQGQLISEIGSTGYSTGPHLHFEIHQPNQGTVNPIALLPEQR